MRVTDAITLPAPPFWKRYLELTKPRVVALMLFTALVGMVLVVEGPAPWERMLLGLMGIALASGAGAVINHVVDRKIDAVMARTRGRPLPTHRVDTPSALVFAAVLAFAAMVVLAAGVNLLTAVLTFSAMIGYAGVYTVLLKRWTPQNVVWGGAAGAAPPLLGATAVTGEITIDGLMLFLIVFVWTPPHFWPLAIARMDEYRHAHIPMLPVTHGIGFTKAQILGYALMLLAVSLFPFAIGMAGWIYLCAAVPLGLRFVWHAWRLYRSDETERAMATFRFSIIYLSALFTVLIADHLIG